MSMIIDGTNGLTFNNATTQASAGSVLQVVNATYNNGGTGYSTSSTTFTSTPLTASITPKFSNSKILVTASVVLFPASGQAVFGTIYRSSTNLGNATGGLSEFNNGNYHYSTTMTYLDSPATTSSTAYTAYFRVTGGTGYFGGDGVTCVITLQEIAV